MAIYRLRVSKKWAARNPGMDWFDERELQLVSEKQQTILRLRGGVEDGRQHTYLEVAAHFGLKSEDWIRWLQNNAMYEINKHREEAQSGRQD